MRTYTKKDGTQFTVYNPAEKSRKYAKDLKNKVDTNTGEILSDTQKAWRSGYLKARKDNAKAYKSRKRARAYNRRKKNG